MTEEEDRLFDAGEEYEAVAHEDLENNIDEFGDSGTREDVRSVVRFYYLECY